MDKIPKKMDFLVKHWQPFVRQLPATFPLVAMAYIQDKRNWIRTRFGSCNFSLILRGRGEFRRGGRVYAVQSPCVITQWPGENLEYGPQLPDETWDEMYLIYSSKWMPKFKRSGLVDLRRPVWPIANLAGVQAQLEELHRLANSGEPERMVDRVDRVAERLILETLLPAAGIHDEPAPLQSLLTDLRGSLTSRVDFTQLAGKYGMSLSTFRRRWQEAVGQPPGQFLLQLRIQEACRLLVESGRPIHEIAAQTGFDDEFYFSRRFRLQTGLAPRDYRKAYQFRPLGGERELAG